MSENKQRPIQFTETRKGGQFDRMAEKYGIHPMIARIMRNRDIEEDGFGEFLHGNLSMLHSPHQLKDGDRAAQILAEKIKGGKHIRVIGDYDVDGVMSSYILTKGMRGLGGNISVQIPHRINDGYGLNRNLIEEARQQEVDTIITCDNGISALEEIELAKSLGMTVIVTDHHRVTIGVPKCDAVVNPHQADCDYPYKELCGATVAWKVLMLLYEQLGHDPQETYEFLENVAFATVADIMPLTGENRILVREGLRRIQHTKNLGMKALISQNSLEGKEIQAYHFGFVLGPCINATGRLDTAKRALELFLTEDRNKAVELASELVTLNESRKQMTTLGVEQAMALYEEKNYEEDPVIVLFLPGVHESIAGLIASKVRERYYKPTLILTEGEDCIKGSGRSIDGYSLDVELTKVKEHLIKFGGHPKAAGLSMEADQIDILREELNRLSPLKAEEEIEKVRIDGVVRPDCLSYDLVEQLAVLEPLGNGNPGPLFGARNLGVDRIAILGKNRSIIKLFLITESGSRMEAVYFGDPEAYLEFLRERYGSEQVDKALKGEDNSLMLSIVYTPSINDFNGTRKLQLVIKYYL